MTSPPQWSSYKRGPLWKSQSCAAVTRFFPCTNGPAKSNSEWSQQAGKKRPIRLPPDCSRRTGSNASDVLRANWRAKLPVSAVNGSCMAGIWKPPCMLR
eukprot:scaffold68065_cov57-Phaeocystis_antarctica.AAC.4